MAFDNYVCIYTYICIYAETYNLVVAIKDHLIINLLTD